MKKALIVFIITVSLLLTARSVNAKVINVDEILDQQFEASGADNLKNALPHDVAEILEGLEVENILKNEGALSFEDLFKNFIDLISLELKDPLTCGFSVLALLLASSMFSSFSEQNNALNYAVTIGVTALAVVPAAKLIISVVSAIKAFGAFMVSFVPIYAGVLASSGKPLTAAGYSSLMLLTAEGINLLCSFVLIPLSGMQLSLGICSPVAVGIKISQIGAMIKKFSIWLLSIISTFLLGFLSVQTLISGSKDNLASKTVKFLAGTTIPVVGPTVSEAMNIIKSCIKMLSSSVLIYAVLAVAFLLLPILLKLLIWRVSMNVCLFSSSVLSLEKSSDLLKSIDSVLAFLIGILTLSLLLFLISLTVVSS